MEELTRQVANWATANAANRNIRLSSSKGKELMVDPDPIRLLGYDWSIRGRTYEDPPRRTSRQRGSFDRDHYPEGPYSGRNNPAYEPRIPNQREEPRQHINMQNYMGTYVISIENEHLRVQLPRPPYPEWVDDEPFPEDDNKTMLATELLDAIVSARMLQVPIVTGIEAEDRAKFCRWHHNDSHTSDKCIVFKNVVKNKLKTRAFTITLE
ncbi:hypothetical protein CRG98_039400 [Punica granatum]|uniref:Uncharacterized protein n=1 Tax=Punica granatum TaxID=22663 RepID=A0A2I0I887_PUNGR|nr:hypothetical protein CRG98_039400 [Punica granatum]